MRKQSFGPLAGDSQQRLNILFITSLFGMMGGAEKNVFEILCGLDKGRFKPHLVCFKGGVLLDELRRLGISAKSIDPKRIFGVDALRKAFHLYRFIRKNKIDIIVTYHHDADIWGGIVGMVSGVPIVISSRRDLGYQLKKYHVWSYRILNRFFSKILSVSEAVKKEIVSREWTRPEKIMTIYNGVECELYGASGKEVSELRTSLGISPEEKVIGMVGALRPIKGHEYIVSAVAELAKTENRFKVLIVGHKGTEYYNKVCNLIGELEVEDYFIFTGERNDIPEVLSAIDILAQPSLSEGFSNAVLEAMAAGKAVVATDRGGSPEAVIDGKTGLLVPAGDPVALAGALRMLLRDEELLAAMGKEGRRRVRSAFSLKKMVEMNEDLYQFMSDGSRRRLTMLTTTAKRTARKAVKMVLCYLLYYSGMTKARMKKLAQRPNILAYHSINSVTITELEMEQEKACFERQMIYLKNNFRLLSLSEFLECRRDGGIYPEGSAMVTFDDGYRDNYVNAYPILRKYNIPAVIFVPAIPLETGKPLFFDGLRHAVMKTERLSLDLRHANMGRYMLDKAHPYLLARAIREICGAAMRMDPASRDALLEDICSRLEVDPEVLNGERMYLTWDELGEMADNGIDVGSHTLNHPRLSTMSFEACKAELVHSKQLIEKRINRKIKTLAYPYGGPNDFNETVEMASKAAGFECAFSACGNGCRHGGYTVSRKIVDSHMSAGILKPYFSAPLFASDLIYRWHKTGHVQPR